jgi:transposase
MEEAAICVVDRDGDIALETSVATDPDAIFKSLKRHVRSLRCVGHEAGSLSRWLQVELKQRGLPAVCLEAWHAHAALSVVRSGVRKATTVLFR